MGYTKTEWHNDGAPAINANNLNKMEQGIHDGIYGSFSLEEGTEIPSGADLNDYTDIGTYCCPSYAVAGTLGHVPYTGSDFKLIVQNIGNGKQQILIYGDAFCRIYVRAYTTSWMAWKRVLDDDNKIETRTLLWENENIQSAFAAQKVPLNLSSYTEYEVHFKFSNTSYGTEVVLKADVGSDMYAVGFFSARFARRTASSDDEGVTFGAGGTFATYGNTSTTENNNILVPIKIYGIKKE